MKRYMEKAEFENYKVISFTSRGKELSDRLLSLVFGARVLEKECCEKSDNRDADKDFTLDSFVRDNFQKGNVLVFIGAAGIAVRAIAPYIEDKTKDPAVIVIDEEGRNVIPLLSGHLGGGVKEAKKIAESLGSNCIVTTASDVAGQFAVDVFASENGFAISDIKKAKEFTARLLEEKKAQYVVDEELESLKGYDVDTGYKNVVRMSEKEMTQSDCNSTDKAFFTISFRNNTMEGALINLIPKCIAVGVGCKKGTPFEKMHDFIERKLSEHNIDKRAVKIIASADLKKDEEGIILAAKEIGAEFKTFSSEVLMSQKGEFTSSEFVKSITGTDNVCERAVSACGCKKLIVSKESFDGMTFAAGVLDGNIAVRSEEKDCKKSGKVFVVGIGPGNYENMTVKAVKKLKECDVIAGYTVYCDLVRAFFPDKEYISTPMMGEEKRVKLAYEKAAEGKKVALVCSGDAGVYGMAGLCYEEAVNYDDVDTEVVPGVTAAISGAALIGAPLIHDFCLISMSDRLTPMELIEKRLRAAASADMVIVIYNPESKSRKGYLSHACEILSEVISPDRVCAIAGNIGRDGENSRIMTLSELRYADVDMFSTVFIGNSSTRNIMEHMITLRGYRSER